MLKVAVERGAAVEEGSLIAVIEAMKMENEITAHKSGTVAELPIAVGASVATGDTLISPLQGTVLKVAVKQGAIVEEGALVAVIEAMKMENEITAHKAGRIAELPIAVGASVASGDTLAVISGAD